MNAKKIPAAKSTETPRPFVNPQYRVPSGGAMKRKRVMSAPTTLAAMKRKPINQLATEGGPKAPLMPSPYAVGDVVQVATHKYPQCVRFIRPSPSGVNWSYYLDRNDSHAVASWTHACRILGKVAQ